MLTCTLEEDGLVLGLKEVGRQWAAWCTHSSWAHVWARPGLRRGGWTPHPQAVVVTAALAFHDVTTLGCFSMLGYLRVPSSVQALSHTVLVSLFLKERERAGKLGLRLALLSDSLSFASLASVCSVLCSLHSTARCSCPEHIALVGPQCLYWLRKQRFWSSRNFHTT